MKAAMPMPIGRMHPHRFIILLWLGLVTWPVFAHDVTGKWQFTVETDAGSGSPTFVLKQEGEKLTGTYNGLFGSAPLTGTVTGDAIQFSFEAEMQGQKGKITYSGRIQSAAKMAGEVDLAGLAKGKWTGTKSD
jgi:hypothetical protein